MIVGLGRYLVARYQGVGPPRTKALDEPAAAAVGVSEKDISDVRVGQDVDRNARAHPQPAVRGVVTAIAPVARQEDDGQPTRTILVLTELPNPSFLLKLR